VRPSARSLAWLLTVALAVPVAVPAGAAVPDAAFTRLARSTGGSLATASTIADVTGDGRADLIVANGRYLNDAENHTVSVFAQASDGSLPTTPTFSVIPSARSDAYILATGDLDDDGDTDLAVALVDGVDGVGAPRRGVDVFLQSGGTLGGPNTLSMAPTPRALAVADMDGDGLDDVVVSRGPAAGPHAYQAAVQEPGGGFADWVVLGSATGPGISIGDVNDDGLTDWVPDGPHASDVPIFVQDAGDHSFVAVGADVGGPVGRAVLGDVNDDGRDDIVGWDGGAAVVRWALATGGGFSSPGSTKTGAAAAIHVADLNDDGRADVAVLGAGAMRLHLQRSAGGLARACRFPTGVTVFDQAAVSSGDVLGDARTELAVADGAASGGLTRILAPADGALPAAVSLSASKTTMPVGKTVSLTGAVSSEGGGCLRTKSVTITRTKEGGATVTLGAADLKANGAFSFTDRPRKAGRYVYRATWDGDETHEPATSPRIRVRAQRLPASLSLAVSDTSIRFGKRVRLTATLKGPTGTPEVSFHAVVDGTRRLLDSVSVNAKGKARLEVRPRRHTTYVATYKGATNYEPASSTRRQVSVRAVVTGEMRHYRFREAGTAVYGCCRAYFWFSVAPAHPRAGVAVTVDVLFEGSWRRLGNETWRLRRDSTMEVFFDLAGGAGFRYRARACFPSDADHIGGCSPFASFRIVA
jgi:hypothetical protein